MAKQGAYFKDKSEAVEFYRNSEENLKDKPDWLVECIIDFAIQYPNYKEYLECEARVKNGDELTAKQKKKYGNLKWDAMHNTYKDGEVIPDMVHIQEEGTFDNIATDPVARERMNKYGLDFGTQLPPDDKVRITVKQKDGTEVTGSCPVNEPDNWGIENKTIET
jgi:hypothetical protein